MKKVAILALHLGVGGIENAIISLSNMLCKKYEVEIISTYKLQEQPVFDVNPKVKITYLMEKLKPNRIELKQAIKSLNVFKIVKELFISMKVLYLRRKLMIKAIKNLDVDVIISTRYLHNAWSGKYGKKSALKIAQEHNHHNNNKKYINKTLRCIKNIDYFVPVSQELTDFYQKKLKNKKTKCIYIPLSLNRYPIKTTNLKNKNIISVGRLVKEKGYIDLIKVFKNVHDKHKDWKLTIVGDGEEKENIISTVKELGLEDSIILCGYKTKSELDDIYMNSSIYVMTSYTESFGLVLVEAESFGIPLIALDSAQGAKEIIKNNENGYLIKNRNLEELSKRIDELIENKDLRKKLGNQGRIFSKKYKEEVVANNWYELIENFKNS